MTPRRAPDDSSADVFAWAMIATGALAVLLALWDVLAEQDESVGASLAMAAVGVLVIALGVQRRRRQ